MIDLVAGYLEDHDATLVETIRLADHVIQPGVTSDEGEGDQWPAIRTKILAADVLIFGTPDLDGAAVEHRQARDGADGRLPSETDDAGRTPAYGKVAVFAIVGNEDGAHCSTAVMAQSLNDVGWTIPAASACYWVGEAMNKKDFMDLPQVPKVTRETAQMVASNAVHLAACSRASPIRRWATDPCRAAPPLSGRA